MFYFEILKHQLDIIECANIWYISVVRCKMEIFKEDENAICKMYRVLIQLKSMPKGEENSHGFDYRTEPFSCTLNRCNKHKTIGVLE